MCIVLDWIKESSCTASAYVYKIVQLLTLLNEWRIYFLKFISHANMKRYINKAVKITILSMKPFGFLVRA